MSRPKKILKVKEPIRIRQRKLTNGSYSLYLDIYVKGVRKVESLGLYLVPEVTPIDRNQNIQIMRIAEQIKAERLMGLQSHSVRQWDKVKRSTITFIDYLCEYEHEKSRFSSSTLKGRSDLRKKIEAYLKETEQYNILLANVDVDFCRGFIGFLSYAKNAVTKNGTLISNGGAHHHQSVLNGALNKAVREGLLQSNPMRAILTNEKFHPSESIREYLTLEEVKTIMDTPCPHNDVKRAFLFSCFTGLRLGDIRSLTWENFIKSPDGNSLHMRITMHKTKKQLLVPLSDEAIDCINFRDNINDPIFNLPIGISNIELNLSKWMRIANINKHITFHCARHTFATMMLTLGTDIYTTSKMLGHSNVNTTAIYAKIVDKKKIEAVGLMNNFFSNKLR